MIAYTYYPSDSRVKHEAEALVEDGFEVDFICLKDNISKNEILRGVNLIRVNQSKSRSNNKLFYILSYFEFFIRAFFVTSKYYLRKKYRVVHINNLPDFLVFAALVPKIFGAKIILDIHDPLPETFLTKFKEGHGNLGYNVLVWIEKISTWFADLVLTVSDPIKFDILVKHGIKQEKIYVICNFADQNLFHFNKNYKIGKKIKLIFHGTIAERFGIENVLYALAKIENNELFEFKIIGTGDYSDKIKSIIEELNLNEIVKFDNNRYHVNELPGLLKEFHLGVISYNLSNATNYMLPVKLLEYFSMGIPVIAPNTKVISHYFPNNLILFYEPSQPECIKDILENIMQNHDVLYQIRNNEYLNRTKYSWDGEKIKYKNIINSLMDEFNGRQN